MVESRWEKSCCGRVGNQKWKEMSGSGDSDNVCVPCGLLPLRSILWMVVTIWDLIRLQLVKNIFFPNHDVSRRHWSVPRPCIFHKLGNSKDMGTGMTVAPYYMPDEVWRNLLGNSWERDGCRKRKRLDVTLWSHTTTCPGSLEPWLCAVLPPGTHQPTSYPSMVSALLPHSCRSPWPKQARGSTDSVPF